MANPQDYQLRPIQESDLEIVLEWRNSERVRSNMYTDHIISLDEHKAWFSSSKNNPFVSHYICEYNKEAIGVINFTNIDQKNRKCYWGFYLGKANVLAGSGSIMELLALDYAFGYLNIRKLCCEVFAFNEKVIKLHKKFGFQQEGYFINHILKEDEYENVVSLALFKENWLDIKDGLYKLVFRIKST